MDEKNHPIFREMNFFSDFILLGHLYVTAISNYIGVTNNSALDLARTYSF